MSGLFGYGQLLTAGQEAERLSREARQLALRWLQEPAMAHCCGIKLQEWAERFGALERSLVWRLTAARAGVYDPVGLSRLLYQTRQDLLAFGRHLRAMGAEPETDEEGERSRVDAGRIVPIGQHQLPPLPYPYDALEPYIDEQTMRLHHDKHHLSYVNGLNKAEQMMAEARQKGDFDLLKHWEREAAFHGAGHYLHTIFWQVMKKGGGGDPTGNLRRQIEADFGGLDPFRQHFSNAAEKVEGVGWALLVWSPRAHRLEILQAEKHQNLSQWDVIPLLVLDVWEHAYYLKYQNDRKAYIKAWWNVVNWEHVAQRFERARQLEWEPF